ncbi:unnamed protein product [Blepharisma stoltei]|uniref:Uncharacterized protein n=1 Tax=Blepharisma stoltei TaxID=1481888 RepID=A0AAU9IW72_9CILI|nr:unnamed protein product [Blepharisma stoltei]
MFYQDLSPSNDTIAANSRNAAESSLSKPIQLTVKAQILLSPTVGPNSGLWWWSSLFMIVIAMALSYFLREKLISIWLIFSIKIYLD